MLELSPISIGAAILILPSDWRQGLFWWLRLRKPAAGQRAVFLAYTAMVFAAVGRRSVDTGACRARTALFELQKMVETWRSTDG
jgi:hypothetical protein